MSMYRQLWLSILASMSIALAASLLASLLNARTYLEAQLAMKNQDNATALALALSQSDPDQARVVLAVTALFESGHYELIQVADPNGKQLLEKVAREGEGGAPAWFVRLLPIRSLPGSAEISGGWQRLGTLTVMSHTRFAYRSLWETALTMSAVILAAGLLGGVLASLVLRRITRPLQAVIEQARAINDHRFISIPMPSVPEVRELASAMNDTVNRLRIDFEEDARRYEAMRQQANFDALTGLPNRAHFLASLESALDSEESSYAALAILRLRQLGKLNRNEGRAVADELLRQVGHALVELTASCSGTFAGRLNGGDFALLLGAGCDPGPRLEVFLQQLCARLQPLAGAYSTSYIGYSHFAPGDNASRLLARIDTALAAADTAGVSAVRQALSDVVEEPLGTEAWRERLRTAIEDATAFSLANYPLRIGDAAIMHREAPLRLRLGDDPAWLPAARFLPLADRIGLIQALDRIALRLAVAELENDDALAGLWINVAAQSIADPEFRRHLLDLLHAHPACRGRLYLEVPEAGGLSRLNALREMSRALKPLQCQLGLDHYGHHFNRIGLLYGLGLDFLKVDVSFIQGVDHNPGNQAFLAGLCEIAHRIGMRVYAEGVETQSELDKLLALGFDGVSGDLPR